METFRKDRQEKKSCMNLKGERLTRIHKFRTFDEKINVLADRICDICTKRCYPNQGKNVVSNKNKCYVPEELLAKSLLFLCHRCETHYK